MQGSTTDFHKYMNEDKLNYGAHSSLVVGGCTAFFDDQSETSATDPFFPSMELLINRGRTTKLTNDTERDPVLAPGTYGDRFLKSKADDILKKKTPHQKSYKLDETNIIVSVTERGGRDFTKRFDELDIDWLVVERQLEDRSDIFRAGRKLRIEISFICKEYPSKNDYTKRTTGDWRPTRGRKRKRHFPLDADVITKLVRFAGDGNVLDSHKDVPQAIRELIYAKAHESSEQKQKRKASSDYPDGSRLCNDDGSNKFRSQDMLQYQGLKGVKFDVYDIIPTIVIPERQGGDQLNVNPEVVNQIDVNQLNPTQRSLFLLINQLNIIMILS
ncbi:hypothetical protein O9K51_11383 [Purpureocillium lavendulum]|uniref:Uncharacterized protein n=1 Tax=Purpureocillium lavendulum TaxID=1247861 RepID=A0AB34FBK6_9HYPO|nr:hypothetical protein O9K51_11383 [Purpureocillium lavendulum]